MEFEKFVKREPEPKDYNIFLVNILRDGRLVHSGLIDTMSNLDWKLDDLLIGAMKKEGFKTVDCIEHLHGTWDYFFDPDNQGRIKNAYKHPFSGNFIRYKESEDRTGNWKFMGSDWTVYVHEEENLKAYNEAFECYLEHQEKLLNDFKEALFKEFDLKEKPNREKIWEKAIGKFGTDHPDKLEKVRNFVSDVAELA